MNSINETTKYLIIGNSAGAIGAIEAIRQTDKVNAITVVTDEPYPAYSRPLISEYLAEKCPLERMLYRPAGFYAAGNVHIKYSVRVLRIDPENRTALLDNGKQIGWEKLLLATGGSPIIPATKGAKSKGVFTFTTLDDAKMIDSNLGNVSDAVVIGGGLIGLSVTEALVKRGVKVTIIEMKDRLLNTMVDIDTSAMVAAAINTAGVNIIVNHTVTEIKGDEKTLSGIILENGEQIPCGMVVLAIGVRPRLELTAGTEIKVNRGILVDRFMATSVPDIYACGDVSEAYDFIYEENRVTPIWPNAYSGGRTAGFNMAGVPVEYYGGASMNSIKYFGLSITSAGMVMPPDDSYLQDRAYLRDRSYEVLSRKDETGYRKVILKDGRVMGMLCTGDIERSGILLSLIREKIPAGSFKNRLVARDFSLISLPENIWRPKLALQGDARKASPCKGAEVQR